jgi:Flp pilus assembly protein TadG
LNRPHASSSARGLLADTRGVSLIEFAIGAALLMLIIFGSVQFGRSLMMRNEMSHALGQAVREVHLRPQIPVEDIVSQLEDRLAGYSTADMDVEVTEIAGTSYMRIAVSLPFVMAMPFMPSRDITLRVETLAPMVSPTQQN